MTLAACYYPCVDGLWYADPRWYGENYTILMDEDGEEIFIKIGTGLKPEDILLEKGIKFSKLEKYSKSTRYVNKKFVPTITYRFRLETNIPKPDAPKIGREKNDKHITQWRYLYGFN
jgi:hypothetical protein